MGYQRPSGNASFRRGYEETNAALTVRLALTSNPFKQPGRFHQPTPHLRLYSFVLLMSLANNTGDCIRYLRTRSASHRKARLVSVGRAKRATYTTDLGDTIGALQAGSSQTRKKVWGCSANSPSPVCVGCEGRHVQHEQQRRAPHDKQTPINILSILPSRLRTHSSVKVTRGKLPTRQRV